ncbi:MAG: hypothetical protein AAF565_00330 [Pseudomonadota bacterium]
MMTQSPQAFDRTTVETAGLSEMSAETESYWLQRTGRRPLAFSGSELCMAMSYVPGSRFWYEVNIYRASEGGFVVRVDMRSKAEGDIEMHDAWECPSFGEVMDSLEAYDAANDIRIDIDPDDPDLSAADMAAHALAIRARAEDARRQFRSLVGELLHELETG